MNEKDNSLPGHHNVDEITDIIYQYIDKFVICPKCSIPELLPFVEGRRKEKNCFSSVPHVVKQLKKLKIVTKLKV